jgi:MFS superfamily sulfate permease-like transporter
VAEHVRSYRGDTLRRDLVAGVTVAALPASLAYAEIAGLSPVVGLYALLLPALAYAIFGSSRQVIVGPDGSIAALVGSAVIPLAADPADRAPLARSSLHAQQPGTMASVSMRTQSWLLWARST